MANKKQNTQKKNVKKVENTKTTKKEKTKDVEKKETVKEINKPKTKKVEETTVKETIKSKDKKTKKNNDDTVFKFFEFFDKYRMTIYGLVAGVLITVFIVIIIWPDRIAKLEDGTEPVAEINGYTVTADMLYEDMKSVYSVSLLLDEIDTKILEEKYPETDEMNDEVESEAENYYNIYEQYYGYTKEQFLSGNGFTSEAKFLEYLILQYRRNLYSEDYVKSLVTDKEIENYYEDEVYGDINTKHILVKVDSSATDEEKTEAENLAKEIISKLNEGKTFDEVKEEYADSITYEELGYKSYNASLESAYMTEMESLANDSYSKTPVKTSYGYHVVYRIDQKEKPELEEVKDEVIETLADKKSADDTNLYYIALDKMRTDAGFTFYDTVLEDKYNTYMSEYK